jgi:class 3 adenylate cyclase
VPCCKCLLVVTCPQDLKDLGVVLGHRRKVQAAIAGFLGAAPAPSEMAAAPTTKPEDAAERRRLTVMFCDLVRSTALSAKFDPEDLRSIIAAYHRCCAELVERNGGFVAKYIRGCHTTASTGRVVWHCRSGLLRHSRLGLERSDLSV